MYKIYIFDIVDNLQGFDYTLIVSCHGNCQLLVEINEYFVFCSSLIGKRNTVEINALFTVIPK